MEVLLFIGIFILVYPFMPNAKTRSRGPLTLVADFLDGRTSPWKDPELELEHPDISLTIAEQELLDDLRD